VKYYLTIFIKEYYKTCEYFYLHSIEFGKIQLCAIVVLNIKVLIFLYKPHDFYVNLFVDLRLYDLQQKTFKLSV
jgi:hypothetical protein